MKEPTLTRADIESTRLEVCLDTQATGPDDVDISTLSRKRKAVPGGSGGEGAGLVGLASKRLRGLFGVKQQTPVDNAET